MNKTMHTGLAKINLFYFPSNAGLNGTSPKVWVTQELCQNCSTLRGTKFKNSTTKFYARITGFYFGLILWHINHCRLFKAKSYVLDI